MTMKHQLPKEVHNAKRKCFESEVRAMSVYILCQLKQQHSFIQTVCDLGTFHTKKFYANYVMSHFRLAESKYIRLKTHQ